MQAITTTTQAPAVATADAEVSFDERTMEFLLTVTQPDGETITFKIGNPEQLTASANTALAKLREELSVDCLQVGRAEGDK